MAVSDKIRSDRKLDPIALRKTASVGSCRSEVQESSSVEGELIKALARMSQRRIKILLHFTRQILEVEDPQVVEAFVAWRNDPKIDTLLDIASALAEEELDQLLFFAEDALKSCKNSH